jgi:predicted anti-sigma-YlaC factor YlaD
VAEHLADCVACRAELVALEHTADLLSTTTPQRPSRDLWPGIAAQLAPRKPARAWWRILMPARPHWALAAAAVIVVALVLLLPFAADHGPGVRLPFEADDEAPLFAQWHAQASLSTGLADPGAVALVAVHRPATPGED